jgi:flagellar motor switch protein FliN
MKKLKPKALLNANVKVEFETGRMHKTLEEVLEFKKGTILKIEESKKDVIRVYVNRRHFANGTALRKNGLMFVKVNELLKK